MSFSLGVFRLWYDTENMIVGPMVTNPHTRHPAVAAGAMASVQELSGGRVFFGIGTGDSAIINLGLRPAKVDEFARYCTTVAGLCAGEAVTWEGTPLRLQWLDRFAPSGGLPRVPLWISAEGPRTLHLAGQIADGVILGVGLTEDVVRDAQARIRAGAESVGRRYEDIELWWLTKPMLADSEQAGWHRLAWTLAGSAHHALRYAVDDKFVPDHLREPLARLQREFVAHTHGRVEHGEANAALLDRLGLTEFVGRRYALAGPPDRIRARIDELASWGAGNLVLMQLVPDRIGFMRAFDEAVGHAYRPAG